MSWVIERFRGRLRHGMMGRVRILFTFTGGTGHFLPSVPIARALVARGHEVAFSAQPAMAPAIAAAGFAAIDSGGVTLAGAAARGPLLPVDRAREERVVREFFAGPVARERAQRLLLVAGDWRPDMIVRDEVDFGAAVAAERLDRPHVAVVVLAAGGLIRPDVVGEPLAALRAEHGLPAEPGAAMLHRHLTLVPVPPSFRTPDDPLPATAHFVRPAVLDPPPAPDPPDVPRGRPVVYFTLGTVFPQESGDLFTRVLAALSRLDAEVVATVGNQVDPAELGPQPPNVHLRRFVPQETLLPHCDLVLSHAGSGSVVGALAFGVPLVLLPMGADQPLNADRGAALGVARVLNPLTAAPDDIRDAATDVLRSPSYRVAARQIQAEAERLPPAAHAACLIEALR